jgi:hypothetical protein
MQKKHGKHITRTVAYGLALCRVVDIHSRYFDTDVTWTIDLATRPVKMSVKIFAQQKGE